MNRNVTKTDENIVLVTHPIQCGVDGWYFRETEVSNGSWEVEGVDLWGRSVSKQGSEPKQLLNEVASMAKDVVREIQLHNK